MKLRKHGAKEFKGAKDDYPFLVVYWLEHIQRVLEELQCTFGDSLSCAISLLKVKACRWWVIVTIVTPKDQVDWNSFLIKFQKKYISRLYFEKKKRVYSIEPRRFCTVEQVCY